MSEQNISRRIALNGLRNTRDLGGMRTEDGRTIRKKRLIRSGQLFFADGEDIKTLGDFGIKKIYDFRSRLEKEEKPDPEVGCAEYIYLPIVRDVTAGLTRDQKSDGEAFDMIIKKIKDDHSFAGKYMQDTYLKMVSDEYAVAQYSHFIDDVSKNEEGAILWHCTAGKDRAGFAAVLLQEILGVSRKDIIADYMSTNEYQKEDIGMILRMLDKKMGISGCEDVIAEFFSASESYILTIYDYVEDRYGGMEGFIRDALNVDEEKKMRIRTMYLE